MNIQMYRILQKFCRCNILVQRNVSHTKYKNILRYNSPSPLNGSYSTHSANNTNVFFRKTLYFTCERNNYDIINMKSQNIQRKQLSIFAKYRQYKLLQAAYASNAADSKRSLQYKHKTVLIYLTTVAVISVGLSYAAVPLYRLYCQATGYGGTTKKKTDVGGELEEMERIEDRPLTIRFEAGTSKRLQWKFKPQQKEVKLTPGETALAFYTAENLTDRPIIGISAYNVIPFDAGKYFNKIQCFCFEEQQLNPYEEVDMPVFFYIDPEFDEDPQMAKVDEIILSYTFFEASDSNVPSAGTHSAR